jgi:hypothetical protein
VSTRPDRIAPERPFGNADHAVTTNATVPAEGGEPGHGASPGGHVSNVRDIVNGLPDRFLNFTGAIATTAAPPTIAAVTDMFTAIAAGRDPGTKPGTVPGYLDQFRHFLTTTGAAVLHAGVTVRSVAHAYTDVIDAVVRLFDRVVWLGWCVDGFGYETTALRLAAHAHAGHIVEADGSTSPLPVSEVGYLVDVHVDGWSLIPARIGSEVFSLFLTLRSAAMLRPPARTPHRPAR